MIHYATLHFRSDAWIDLQLDYIERHTSEEFRVWACLDGIDRGHFGKFHHAEDHGEGIPEEYGHLAGLICEAAEPGDLLVFLHGDTLPIADWVGPVRELIAAGTPLVGIQRDENLGEPHPHACFTVTTPELWRELGSSWGDGPEWVGTTGRTVTDLGALLWRDLERQGIRWEPLLRSNVHDIHPVWFGVYGGIVYHHGAAFRRPICRADADPGVGLPLPLRRLRHYGIIRVNERRSRRLYRRLCDGDEFFRELIADSTAPDIASAAAG